MQVNTSILQTSNMCEKVRKNIMLEWEDLHPNDKEGDGNTDEQTLVIIYTLLFSLCATVDEQERMAALKLLLALCVLNTIRESHGVVNIDPEKKQQIDDFINGIVFNCERHNIAGMNLAVVYQGETLYTTGYGLKNLGKTCILDLDRLNMYFVGAAKDFNPKSTTANY